MQKSKSSSNVGQFLSRKILKSFYKSQSRPNTPAALSKWEPVGKFAWASNSGDRVLIQDSNLQNLTDIETKILQRVAIEKISELNLGVNVSLDQDSKPHKRRILAKKKAMTISFFDINRRDDQGGDHGLFGNSLESCIVNDKKRCGTLKESTEHGPRNSIGALFRGSGSGSTNKLHESVRSYESLPSSTFSLASPHDDYKCFVSERDCSAKSSTGYFGNLSKSTKMPISRSQSDVRRHSQEFYAQHQIYFKEQVVVTSNVLKVPSFVTLCIKYLEDRGLHEVGLFRVSTSRKRVKQMREEFDTNTVEDIDAETSPHDVATLLKEFLRDLPEPLLCSGLYKAFLETQRIRNRRLQLEAISHLIKLLPTPHRDTLYVLLKFLAKVASCSDDVTNHDGSVQIPGNKMDSNNLATVFAPNVLRTALKNFSHNISTDVTSCGDSNAQESMSDAINIIRIMIDHYEEMFKVSAELIDIVYSHMLDICPEKLYYICELRRQSCREDISKSCSSLRNSDPNVSHSISATSMQKLSTCNISSGVVVGSSLISPTKSNRLYKRESVMHQNNASRVPEVMINGSNDSKRCASRHSMTQKLRQYDRISNAINTDLVDRRKSSPNIFDKSCIVAASLQIPLPSAQISHFKSSPHSSLQRKSPFIREDLDEAFCKSEPPPSTPKSTVTNAMDIFNYPDNYIGDETIGQRKKIFNQILPIPGSLSFSTKMGGPTNNCRQGQIARQQTKQQQKSPNFNTRHVGVNFSTMTNTSYCTTDIDDSSILVVMGNSMNMTKLDSLQREKNSGGNDPKLPVGISNIGGEILRSKTADLERMSFAKQQQTQPQPETMQRSSNISVDSIMPSTITTPTTTPHLYKRQEIIQSTKRLSNKK